MINKLNKYDLNCSVFNSYDFDDCMSLNELLCRFFTKINECIEASNKSLNLLEWLHEVGLKQEVVTLLGQWKDDGTLAELISEQILTEIKQNIENNKNAIEQLQLKDTTHDEDISVLKNDVLKLKNNSLSIINVIERIKLDNTGTTCNSEKLQTFINETQGNIILYFPSGIYKFNTSVTCDKSVFVKGEREFTKLTTNGSGAIFKFNAPIVSISQLLLETTSPVRNEFTVYVTNASRLCVDNCHFTNTMGKESGLRIENVITSIVDKCVFNHANISLKTWDCKILNTWVWALWRPYGIGIYGGSGNIVLQNVDIVPPFRTENGIKNSPVINGIKAGIWINSEGGTPTNNVIMENVYFDGNPGLDTGIGLLCENSFGITLSSYKANKMNSNVIVIDTCYDVIISKGMHYENNKYDQEAHEILIKKTGTGKHSDIQIDSCHFINYVTTGITKPTSAIKVDESADGSARITNNYIGQSGNGNAYGNTEIEVITIPKELWTNKGTKTVYRSSGSFTFSGSGATLTLPIPLAYTPKQKEYEFSVENGFTPNLRVQQTNNYQAWVASSESIESKILYYDIKLGK